MRSLVTIHIENIKNQGTVAFGWTDRRISFTTVWSGGRSIREKVYKLWLGNYRRCRGATATIAIHPMSDVVKSLILPFLLGHWFWGIFYSFAVRHLSARCNSPLIFALRMRHVLPSTSLLVDPTGAGISAMKRTCSRIGAAAGHCCRRPCLVRTLSSLLL